MHNPLDSSDQTTVYSMYALKLAPEAQALTWYINF